MPEFFTTEKFQNFLAYEWAGNSMYEIVIAVLICIGLLIIIKLFLDIIFRMLERVAERTHFRIPLLVVHFLETVPLWMWIILAVTGTAHLLTIPSSIQTALAVVALAIIVALSVQLLQQVLEYLLYRQGIENVNRQQVVERVAEMKERCRVIYEQLIRIAFYTEDMKKDGMPPPSPRDRISALREMSKIDLAIFGVEMDAGIYERHLGTLELDKRNKLFIFPDGFQK
jgi:hypothetical protein